MPKINQLTRASQIADSDLIPKENSAGTSTESATAAQLAEYFRGKGVQVDNTLSTPGAAADAAKTGAEVTDLKNAVFNYNTVDLLPMRDERTSRNVTLTPNGDGTYTIKNTASATTAISLYNEDSMPRGIVAGGTYTYKCVIPVTGVKYRLYAYINGTYQSEPFLDVTASTENGTLTIPANTTGLNIAIYIPSGTAFSNNIIYFHILDAKSNKELTTAIDGLRILNPDNYSGGDANRIQQCINALANGGMGGIIVINRTYTLNSNVTCTLNTNSDTALNDHAFITFLGIGKNAGFEFGASSVSFKGNDAGSPYGGFRFKNLYFYQHSTGVGLGSAFTQMAGMIRCVFENCRFSGFSKVFNAGNAGSASRNIIQNLTCINCYFTDCTDYVLDAYTIGDIGQAAYIYAVNFISCIVEKCKGLIKGSASSGYSVWTALNIENCTIESCTGIPIVFGVGARSVNIQRNYFEKNDYNNTHICIDMSQLFGVNLTNRASVLGVNICDNVFVKGISSGNYTAHCTAIKIPAYEPWSETEDPEKVHGVIARNVSEDVFIIYDTQTPFVNKRRFRVEDNAIDEAFDASVLYNYDNPYSSTRPSSPKAGYTMYDSSLGKAIWYTGSGWVDANGNAVT